MTGVKLAEKAGISQSKVSKLETGHQVPTASDIEAIGRALELTDSRQQELAERAEKLRTEFFAWRFRRPRSASDAHRIAKDLEVAAKLVRAIDVVTIPAALQTAGYASEVVSRALHPFGRPEDDVKAAVAERVRRQEALVDPNRTYEFLVLEAAFSFRYGPWETMLAQVDRIRSLATLENVSIGVIPRTQDLPVVPGDAFVVFDDEVVATETVSGVVFERGGDEVSRYLTIWSELWRVALVDAEADRLLGSLYDDFAERTRSR